MRALLPLLTVSALAIAILARSVSADVRLPGLFGDGMVLQRDANVAVWGWAKPGGKVHVELQQRRLPDMVISAIADADGNWRAVFSHMEAGGPFRMAISCEGNAVVLHDVYVGDVWLCSGQSNMGTYVRDESNMAQEIREANCPQIRLFKSPADASPVALADIQASWTPCTPQTAGGFPGAAYFFARKLQKELGVPIGLLHAAVGDSSILAWTRPGVLEEVAALKKYVDAGAKARADFARHRTPTAPSRTPNEFRGPGGMLYNAMVAPMVGYTLRGAIWYQGEKDGGRYGDYPLLFRAMVSDWRKRWGCGEFPFLFVQLATYKGWGVSQAGPDPLPNEGDWGFIREAQTRCLEVPNTAMAVSLNRLDFEDAHCKNKREVGERLALAALAKSYGRQVEYSGPMYESMKVENGKVRLTFSHTAGGLALVGERGKNGLAIAGKDRTFVWADAKVEGEALVLWSDEAPEPAAVRYAWANFPYFGLSNKAGLPAPTFRTDDWPEKK